MSLGRNIVLIGYRGAGKTTVGRELARLAGVRFVDSDETISRQAGCTIAEVFAREGEAGFRRRERQVIESITRGRESPGQRTVLAVGGGAILDPRNVANLRAFGVVVWLRVDMGELAQRIAADPATGDQRPRLAEGRDEAGVHAPPEREVLYAASSDCIVDAGKKTPSDVARTILEQPLGCSE